MSKKNNAAAKRKKRAYLFRYQRGLCFWCQQPMKLIEFPTGHAANKVKQRVPHEAATLEHLESRLHPDRGEYPGTMRVVLSHSRCNHAYNQRTEKEVGIEELWRRAGAPPASGPRPRYKTPDSPAPDTNVSKAVR